MKLHSFVSPTLDVHDKPLRYGVSFDDEEAQVVEFDADISHPDDYDWQLQGRANINEQQTTHQIAEEGCTY